MATTIYVERNQKRVQAGTIEPGFFSGLFDCETREPVKKFTAASSFGGGFDFHTFGAAELWLKTRAYVRS